MSNAFIQAASASLDAIETARAEKKILVSDVVDAQGLQYVDIVMEGGGVLGLALVGYLYALERAGIRFLSIGGTSAGSIVSLLAAAAGQPHEARAEKLIEVMAAMPIATFQDGDDDARAFIDWLLQDSDKLFRPGISMAEVTAWLAGISKIAQVRDNFTDDLGLCKGQVFQDWVHDRLADFGVGSADTLQGIMQARAGSLQYVGSEADGTTRTANASASLCLIAADVTTERKVEFPKDAGLYFADPPNLDPSHFVRASMSVPFFFHPKRCRIPNTAGGAWNEAIADGAERAARFGKAWPPVECVMVDGGVMSNFPIDAFHAYGRVPVRPTFGVKLEVERPYTDITTPVGLLLQLFNGARHCRDNDFIAKNPDFNRLVQTIDTGPHNWLDFNIAAAAQVDLFARGARAAAEFLLGDGKGRQGFDWAGYKEIRRGLAQVSIAAAAGLART